MKNFSGQIHITRQRSGTSKIQQGPFLGYDINVPVLRVGNLFVNTLANGVRMFTAPKFRQRRKASADFADDAAELIFSLNGIPYTPPRKIIGRVVEELK